MPLLVAVDRDSRQVKYFQMATSRFCSQTALDSKETPNSPEAASHREISVETAQALDPNPCLAPGTDLRRLQAIARLPLVERAYSRILYKPIIAASFGLYYAQVERQSRHWLEGITVCGHRNKDWRNEL